MGVLTTVALIIFIVEAQLPPLAPVPGIKLGLANIVSLFALFWIGRKEAFMILLVRIVLGSIFTGQMVVLFYSLAGGLLSFCVIALLYKSFSLDAIWIPSILSGLLHNIGQITVAVWLTHSVAILAYLPLLMIAGMATGLFTGLCTQFLIKQKPFLKKPFEGA